jgi:pimeloyl-ACP methyl ester carboxylesterase
MKQEHTEIVNGVRVTKAGNKDNYPLLYLHPTGHPPENLNHIQLLAEDNFVIAPNYYDLISKTPKLTNTNILVTLESTITDIPKAVVGSSIGAALSLLYASKHPELDFCLAASPVGLDLKRRWVKWLYHFGVMHAKAIKAPRELRGLDDGLKLMTREFRKNPKAVMRGLHFAKEINIEQELSEIKVPTSIIVGENDNFIPEKTVGLKMAELILGSTAEVVSPYGHLWYVYQPEIIANWVKKLKK